MMKRLLLIGLTALLTMGGIWWWLQSPSSVDVTLTIAEDAAVVGMRNIEVIVGGEKTGWDELKRGETVRARFQPDPQGAPELTLIYLLKPAEGATTSDERHYWRGPAVRPGQGYDIKLLLDARGRVVETHCMRPCTLNLNDW